jgi:hypothetical protein
MNRGDSGDVNRRRRHSDPERAAQESRAALRALLHPHHIVALSALGRAAVER